MQIDFSKAHILDKVPKTGYCGMLRYFIVVRDSDYMKNIIDAYGHLVLDKWYRTISTDNMLVYFKNSKWKLRGKVCSSDGKCNIFREDGSFVLQDWLDNFTFTMNNDHSIYELIRYGENNKTYYNFADENGKLLLDDWIDKNQVSFYELKYAFVE